jgi:hypothetical protein
LLSPYFPTTSMPKYLVFREAKSARAHFYLLSPSSRGAGERNCDNK